MDLEGRIQSVLEDALSKKPKNIKYDKNLLSLLGKYDNCIITSDILCNDGFEKYYNEKIIPTLKKLKQDGKELVIYLPKSEANRIIDNNASKSVYDKYLAMQTWIKIDDVSIDSIAQRYFNKRILVITNDHARANDIKYYTQNSSVKCYFKSFNNRGLITYKKPEKPIDTRKVILKNIPRLHESIRCGIGGSVFTDTLTNRIGGGGESIVYRISNGYLAKIYEPNKNGEVYPAYTIDKLKRLIFLKDIVPSGIFLPQGLVYNDNNECVGFLMKKAQGFIIQNIFSSSKMRQQRGYGNLVVGDLLTLCKNFLVLVKFLHSQKIMIGDVNPQNIMINAKKEVFLIDCDSYQMGRFPCPVGTEDFMSPRLLNNRNKSLSQTLRTIGDELHGIGVMLFCIMTLGNHPYGSRGDCKRLGNVKIMNFIFKKNPNLIPAAAKKYWDRMPPILQDKFHNAFDKSGKNSSEGKRLNADNWLKIFEGLLQDAMLCEQRLP